MLEAWGMVCAGTAALVIGLLLVRSRMKAAAGFGKAIVLGPVFEAVALAMFAAEHFTAPHDLAAVVPHWLPWHVFWVYFFGAALLAAAISFILWRGVRWSAALLAAFFFLIVLSLDVPGIPAGLHDRFFWILSVRETCFGAGALVLAASVWPRERRGAVLERVGRWVEAAVLIFYGVEHLLHPHHVPGVPLEKMTPAWVPAPALLASVIGCVLIAGGLGLLAPRGARAAAAICGLVLVVLTAGFYVPIFLTELQSPLAIEGLNYIGDTLLFGATVLLAGWVSEREPVRSIAGRMQVAGHAV